MRCQKETLKSVKAERASRMALDAATFLAATRGLGWESSHPELLQFYGTTFSILSSELVIFMGREIRPLDLLVAYTPIAHAELIGREDSERRYVVYDQF